MADWVVSLFHSFPHMTFDLKHVLSTFRPDDRDYVEALIFWSAVSLVFSMVLVLSVIIVWSVRCCRKSKEEAKRSKKIRQLCSWLFIVSIFCFIWLGLSLFSNERINRGLSSSSDSLQDLSKDVETALNKLEDINRTLSVNMSTVIEDIAKTFQTLWNRTKLQNSTEEEEVVHLLRNVSFSFDEAKNDTWQIDEVFRDLQYISEASDCVRRVEFERWITVAVLLVIMIIVLFGGVVGFCRHSKKAAVLFSGLGLVIFILTWILFSLALGITVGLADYCSDPEPFIVSMFKLNSTKESVRFYLKCDKKKKESPEVLEKVTTEIESSLNNINDCTYSMKLIFKSLYPESKKLQKECSNLQSDVKFIQGNLFALKSQFVCSNPGKDDFDEANTGICYCAMTGAGLLLMGLFLLGMFLFVLLILVSKAWHLYTRRPMDYVEVDDEDPFLPRGDRSNIPADFYGTHVYNPRTRFASNADSEQGESSTPMWQARATAPPPAYDSVG